MSYVHKYTAPGILADVDGFREEYVGMRKGLANARPDEWLAAWPGVYGTLELPAEGEPFLCMVTDGRRLSAVYALQHLVGCTYINLYCGTVFDLGQGHQLIVLSGLSRMPCESKAEEAEWVQ